MSLGIYDLLMLMGAPALTVFFVQLWCQKRATKRKEANAALVKDKDDSVKVKLALQALLRDRLRRNYIMHSSCGLIDMADKENFDNLYNIYHSLGQNGVMDDMYADIMALPVVSSKPITTSTVASPSVEKPTVDTQHASTITIKRPIKRRSNKKSKKIGGF